MKQYLLSIYQPDGPPPPSVDLEKVMRDVGALVQEIKATGVWVFDGGLHPPSRATVVRVQEGEVLTTDGPFAEGKRRRWRSRSSGATPHSSRATPRRPWPS